MKKEYGEGFNNGVEAGKKIDRESHSYDWAIGVVILITILFFVAVGFIVTNYYNSPNTKLELEYCGFNGEKEGDILTCYCKYNYGNGYIGVETQSGFASQYVCHNIETGDDKMYVDKMIGNIK